MKKVVLIVTMVGMPLAAQAWEGGLFFGQQTYGTNSSGVFSSEVKSRVIGSLHLGHRLVDFETGLLQVTAAYQPNTKADMVMSSGAVLNYEHQYTGLGIMYSFKKPVSIGFGLDYRLETLRAGVAQSQNYSRPWIRVNALYSFTEFDFNPFIGLETAIPVLKSHEIAPENMAPKLQIGIYAGVRF